MATADWANGSSAVSLASFWQQAPFVACSRTEDESPASANTLHHERLRLRTDGWSVSTSSSSSATRSPFGVSASPHRRVRATSWIRSAMRVSRSIRTRRSWASSTSRLVRVTAVTVADRRVRRSAANLAEEMTGTEPNTLVLELDFHLSIRDEIHGMGELAAPGDDLAGFDLLRMQ